MIHIAREVYTPTVIYHPWQPSLNNDGLHTASPYCSLPYHLRSGINYHYGLLPKISKTSVLFPFGHLCEMGATAACSGAQQLSNPSLRLSLDHERAACPSHLFDHHPFGCCLLPSPGMPTQRRLSSKIPRKKLNCHHYAGNSVVRVDLYNDISLGQIAPAIGYRRDRGVGT